jgi:hypothetical protein
VDLTSVGQALPVSDAEMTNTHSRQALWEHANDSSTCSFFNDAFSVSHNLQCRIKCGEWLVNWEGCERKLVVT